MRAGELAARLRANAEAMKRHKAFTREWKDAVAIQRSALFSSLPLILAALDVAEAEREYDALGLKESRFVWDARTRRRLAAMAALRKAEGTT